MTQPPKTDRGRKRIREAEDERESKTQKPNHESQSDSLSGLTTFLHHVPAPLSPQRRYRAYESEPDGEADNNAPSFRERNTLIHKGPIRQPNSPSPAPTISTMPNTPRAMSSGLKIDGDFGGVQHSSPPSLVTSVSARQRPQQRGRVEPPQQTEPHESASQNAIRIPHGEDSYQSSPIMTKYRAELENECKSTTKMVELVISIVEELGSEMNERFDALHYEMVDRFDALHDEMVDRFNALHDEMVDQDQDDN
ncbi:hypothetical protein ARSEF4850_003630 [Beauveria asiatica]